MFTELYQRAGLCVALRLIPPGQQDYNVKKLYQERSLPKQAQNTCLWPLMQRPCRTPNQFYARALAFDLLNTQHKNRDSTEIVSIAHTKGAVAAAGSTGKSHHTIGIDIEHQSRQIPTVLKKYYLTSEDLHTGLNTLQLWCLKEAAFKCLDNFSKTLSLKHIRIKQQNSSGFLLQAGGKSCTGNLWLSKTNYYIALAWS